MKLLKKTQSLLLAACLAVPLFGGTVFAASGTLMFSDPETQVGDTVSVTMVIESSGSVLGETSIVLNYDTEYLEFLSGDDFETDYDGTLTYTNKGDGTATEYETTLEFTALQTGETLISVEKSTAYLYSGDTLTLSEGSSVVTIAAADDGTTQIEPSGMAGATDIVVTVNGVDYYFSEGFAESEIPEGYEETALTFHGEDRAFVENDADVYLGYLVDEDGNGDFFLYDEEDATFWPYTAISISDTTTIVLLSDTSELSIPEDYTDGIMTVGDLEYPYWIDPEEEGYDILYALNTTTGAKGFYRYDPEDDTYQSYTMPAAEEESTDTGSLLGKISELAAQYPLFILIGLCVLVFFLILTAVKLIWRNHELDYIYDRYDLSFDEEGKTVSDGRQEEISNPQNEPDVPSAAEEGKTDEKVSTEDTDAEITEKQILEYFERMEQDKE